MCKLPNKVRTAKIYLMEVQISSIYNLGHLIKFLLLILGSQKHIASVRL